MHLHELTRKPQTEREKRVQGAARSMAESMLYVIAFVAFAAADLISGSSWIVWAAAVGLLWRVPDLVDSREELRRARVALTRDRTTPDRPPLLSEQDFRQRCQELATPVEIEEPEQPPDPTPRAFCDSAWDRWESRDLRVFRNNVAALDRPFTARTDCQSGHVGEHLMGEAWDALDGRRVLRICRFTCHSTWSETV